MKQEYQQIQSISELSDIPHAWGFGERQEKNNPTYTVNFKML